MDLLSRLVHSPDFQLWIVFSPMSGTRRSQNRKASVSGEGRYAAAQRRRSREKGPTMARKILIPILAVLSLSLCWLYAQQSGHTLWSPDYEPTNVDWNDRRDEVKEAFVSSWDAYAAHAWGAPVWPMPQNCCTR